MVHWRWTVFLPLALMLLARTQVRAAAADQMNFAACPVRHAPEHYCCEYSKSTRVLYTKYNRPSGGAYASYYEHGWQRQRQVSFPYPTSHPNTPEFSYNDPSTICRVQSRIDVETAMLKEELQCARTNASLEAASQDSSVFWTYATNYRNNNASFPLNAFCYSIMLSDGTVDVELMDKCTTTSFTVKSRFMTFTEPTLLTIYMLYLTFFATLIGWVVYKHWMQNVHMAMHEINKKLIHISPTSLRSVAGNSIDRHTSVRLSDTRLQFDAAKGILQTGYSKSLIGNFVFGCVVVASLALNLLLVMIICDFYGNFTPPLFDTSEDNALVFIIIWVITAIWFMIILAMHDRILNFFRLGVPLDRCEYVYMHKRDETKVMLADRSGLSEFVARVEGCFAFKGKINGYCETVPVVEVDGLRYVEFQHLRYVYEATEHRFVPGTVALGHTFDQMQLEVTGLSEAEAKYRYNTVGSNSVDVAMPSLFVSMAHEFFKLLYIYQIMCYYVWYYFTYWNMGIFMTIVILGAAAVNIYTHRQIQSSVIKMTCYRTDVTVFRSGKWQIISSPDIVPGDVVKVSENWTLPCDMAIVKGTTLCDESMLTGESMPVQKFAIPDNSCEVYDAEKGSKKHTLFAGTRVLSSGRHEQIIAIVQATGAHTTKGQLIQSILFPIPMRFKYNEHLKVLITILFIYAIIACTFVIKFLLSNENLNNRYAAFCYAIFVLSAIISPLLPVVITVGQMNASQRLKKLGVYSLNVERITLCGKVRIFCFDKTGTLTKQGLDYLGVQPVKNCLFTPIVSDTRDAPSSDELLYALTTCHSVGSLHDRLVGNEVEVRMFMATGWELIEKEGIEPCVRSNEDPTLQLDFIKRYDFDHRRMSMSVVVRNRKSGKYYVFCKGSYERMQQLSTRNSIPADYKKVADRLAKDGCYVLGLSYRELPKHWTHEQVVEFATNREAVDEQLCLLGLILFRNELKEGTEKAIAKLKAGDIRTVMITGDNAMCGCYIARKSGVLSSSARVLLGEVVPTMEGKQLVWRDVDSDEEYNLPAVKVMVERGDDVELAVTGVAFDELVAMGEIHGLLLYIRIFSRMTPDGKVECVKLHMETGAVTGMCGDGGNDCGALRFAHAGVALSDAEASVVSPFTSKLKTIESVVDLCREGRCSVATAFASVKFLIMYGLIGSVLRLYMYFQAINMSQWCWILVEGFTIVGFSYVITLSKPLNELKEMRPTSSLIGPTTLSSILGQEAINIIFLSCSTHLLTSQVWYCPYSPENVDVAKWWLMSDNHLATTLFFTIISQQLIAAWVFSFGSTFRQPICKNYSLVVFFMTAGALNMYMLLGEPSIITDRFRISSGTNVVGLPDIPMPMNFRVKLLALLVGNVLACILFEYLVVLGPVRSYFRNKFHKDMIPMNK